jgi:tryptophanyl-tRNA synthetase
MTNKEYKKKLEIFNQLNLELKQKIDSTNLESFSRIKKYMKGKSIHIDRNIVTAHLDFEKIASFIANDNEFYVVSGLNPSSDLHLGHKALFDFLLSLQKMGANIVIPITNDESYADNKLKTLSASRKRAYEKVIPNIIALGFDPKKTKLFVDSDYDFIYDFAMHIGKQIKLKQVEQLFGKSALQNISQIFYRGTVQIAQILLPQLPEFGGPKNTLIPVGPDQHPYITLSRKIAKKFDMTPPSEICINFLQSLKNPGKKMSGSIAETAIYLNDTPNNIKNKINKAYTGSLEKLSDHKKYGAIPEICSVFQILRYHHPDNEFVNNVYDSYKKGKMGASELKNLTIEFLVDMLNEHKTKVEKIKNIDEFILKKKLNSFLEYKGGKNE